MTTREEMPKAYNPASVEGETYRRWEESGAFTPQPDPERAPYTIIMPPPNLTGELHLGHAMMDTVEDILVRWRRMQGKSTLWLPGVDHAALPVNFLVERQLAEEGLTRHQIGREAFLERIWDFVHKNRARIFTQHKRLGISTDWSRESFTMDPGPAKAVRKIFVDLFEKGLIYRGNRLINWCPGCRSALSDLEVEREDEDSFLWHVRYPLIDNEGKDTGESITIATTRPETILADTGIAVHPDDERYAHLKDVRARVPLIGREIPIVFDEAIEKDFGSGALKVTPGHDQTDFEIGERHNLPTVNSINEDGTLNDEAGPYSGMDRFEARKRVVEDLTAQGLLLKEEPYRHAVGHCSRCGTVVEPLMSEQWFVAMTRVYGDGPNGPRSLAGDGLKAVDPGWIGPDGKQTRVKMVPERHLRVYQNWLENIRDWTISRQIWWGHRIPVWYCDDCGQMTVPLVDPDVCAHCGSAKIRQDEDTLDTWFSSALWPFSTLGWPDDTEDLRYFYPTTVMETGYDIIFLWVARMIMMGTFALDEVPFEWVYFHGTVRDDQGQRMSKSKGNGVDPEVLVDRYGADALRFKLVTAGGTGNDQRLEEPRMEAARNFANKLWNASRFVLSQLEPGQRVEAPSEGMSLPVEDRWILSRLGGLMLNVDRLMERFELGEAGREIESFLWDEFCDWYLEIAKIRLRSGDEASPMPVLVHVLDSCLRLLHPYMPYVTEEIWSGSGELRRHLDEDYGDLLLVARYPQVSQQEYEAVWRDEDAEREMSLVLDIIRAVRNIRRERGLDASRWLEAYVVADASIAKHAAAIEALARIRPVHFVAHQSHAPTESVATAILADAQVVLPLTGLIDRDAERVKLEREREQMRSQVEGLERQLNNDKFLAGARAEVIAGARQRLEDASSRLTGIEARLAELG